MDEIKAIVKVCKGEMTLFFPEYEANPGCIDCFTAKEAHNEATLGYYAKATNPVSAKMNAEAASLIDLYEKRHDCKIVRVYRQSFEQRQRAWGQI